MTEELVALGIVLVGGAALSGAYVGVLGKLVYDHLNAPPSKRE